VVEEAFSRENHTEHGPPGMTMVKKNQRVLIRMVSTMGALNIGIAMEKSFKYLSMTTVT